MGCNYYLVRESNEIDGEYIKELIDNKRLDEVVEYVGDYKEKSNPIHIGKSSMGWKFLFNHNNWGYFDDNKESLIEFLKSGKIMDEYNMEMPFDEFWEFVESKSDGIDDYEYNTNWHKYHPKTSKPSYMENGVTYDEYHDGLRFSTSTEFC